MNVEPEDYRVKNAREGKAIYIPGKSVEEMAAQSAKSKAGKAQSETSPDLLTSIRASMAEIDTLANDVQ